MEKVSKKYPLLKSLSDSNLLICLIVVCALFIPTLNRPWLIYDERIISEGLFFPTASSFGEIFEIIQRFGLNFNLNSSNTIYTSNYVTRSSPFGLIFGMLMGFFFKKDPFLYHLFNLFLHLINTCLFYFILKTTLKSRYLLIILALLWTVHPLMVEPVLLSINVGATFSYLFFFAFLLDFLYNREKNKSDLRKFTIPFLFLIPMLTNEYIVSLPLVLFVISFCFSYKENAFKKALRISIEETKPYFFGLAAYIFFFLFLSHYSTGQPYIENQFLVFLERIFWLSPQIFFHLLKLVFYPHILSIDQSLFVKLGKTISDPYSIFCVLFLALWLFVPLYFFMRQKKLANIFLLSWTFFFALFPFLHILMPSYTLSAERYLYAPLALLIFCFARILPLGVKPVVNVLVAILLVLCLVRSHARTLDWKDNYTFINSTYKAINDPFFKAVHLGMLGKAVSVLEPEQQIEIRELFSKALELLSKAKEKAIKDKLKYQKNLPLVIKSYGLDYESIASKIAFLEASSKCLELKEDHKIGLEVLKPYVKRLKNLDPRILELYTHLLILDKDYKKAEEVLLKANSTYPKLSFILTKLSDFYITYKNDLKKGEGYLLDAIKIYTYDPEILLKLVNFYESQNNQLATAHYSYLFGLRTQSRLAYEKSLSLYLSVNEMRKAKRILNKLLKISPGDPETLYFASEYYYKLKNYQMAFSYLTNAYSLVKNGSRTALAFDIVYTLAKLYLLQGNKEQATLLLEDISSLAGDNIKNLYKLSRLYKSLGLIDKSNYYLQKMKSSSNS